MSGTGPHAFVSFSPADARLGAAVCKYLAAAGLTVVRAPAERDGPIPWLAQVARRVARSRRHVILLSDRTPIGWAQAELAFALRQLDQEIVPLVRRSARIEVPAGLTPHHLPDEPAALQAALARLATRLNAPPAAAPVVEADGRPFPGLRPFGLHDGRWFFGRDRAVAEATRDLGRGGVRWLRIEGTQGVGKTSFARAGICGAVLRGACGPPAEWAVVAFRPGATPMTSLVQALGPVLGRGDVDRVDERLADPGGLPGLLADALPAGGLLLVIDHFDDLATASAEVSAEVERFDAVLGRALATPDVPLLLVTAGTTAQSRRTLDLLPKLTEAVPSSTVYTLGGLTPAELERAIVGPLQRSGRRWPADLVERLQHDANRIAGTPGPLAWMLARLHREPHPTLDLYARMGGLQYGPGRALDARLEVLTGEKRDRIITLILALIHAGRGQNDSLAALAPDDAVAIAGGGPEGRALIKGLLHGAPGAPDPLLQVDSADPWYRLAHSELLRIWPRLRGLLATWRAVIERHADVERAAASWARRRRDPAALPTGARLELHLGADLPGADRERLRAILSTTARAYVGAAEATERARRTAEEAVEAAELQAIATRRAHAEAAARVLSRRLTLIGGIAIGGVVVLLLFLVAARRDAADAKGALERARADHARAAAALADRVAAGKALSKSTRTLGDARRDLEATVERARKTAGRAAAEAEQLLQIADGFADWSGERAERLGGVGVRLRREANAWLIERLARSLEGEPDHDRVRLLLARRQAAQAADLAVGGPVSALRARFVAALNTLAPLTRRQRPAPAALRARAAILDAAAAANGRRRGFGPWLQASADAVETWRRLVRLYPSAPRHPMGLAAALHAHAGRLRRADKDATATLQEADALYTALVKAAPGDFQRAYALTDVRCLRAEALLVRAREADARAVLAQAEAQLEAATAIATADGRSALRVLTRRIRRLRQRLGP